MSRCWANSVASFLSALFRLQVRIVGPNCFGLPPAQEWLSYGHDPGGLRFSSLNQINRTNVDQLQRAWTYQVPAFPGGGIVAFENTPLMIDDVLYFAVPTGQAIAVDAETGKQLWVFDPLSGVSEQPNPVPNRGVAYWRASGARSRILYVSAVWQQGSRLI